MGGLSLLSGRRVPADAATVGVVAGAEKGGVVAATGRVAAQVGLWALVACTTGRDDAAGADAEQGVDTGIARRTLSGAESAAGGSRSVAAPVSVGGGVTPAAPDGGCIGEVSGMACIPAGFFRRGSDDGPAHARPAAVVWLHSFYMDRQEVRTDLYRACVKQGRCPIAGPRYRDFDRPDQPINGVSWYDAVAYCKARGKHLPTEAQWEKAARGSDGRLYPWGNASATCERAIIRDEWGRGCGLEKAGRRPWVGRPWPVGSRPPGIHGLYDMAGNAWEWVADWASRSYASCGSACEGVEPKGPCDGRAICPGHRRKVVRGGSWYWDATYATAVYRRTHRPENRPFHHFGFRCAASLDEMRRLHPSR
ncbi:MAG: SUMF1/EgtB/PvdO family nonheme iron enzyme [Nannocystaceae bacterium]